MPNIRRCLVLASVCAFTVGSGASAIPVTFDLTGETFNAPTATIAAGGITLTVTAGGGVVGRDGAGVGVGPSSSDGGNAGASDILQGSGESLTFSFDGGQLPSGVTFLSASFSAVEGGPGNSGDDANLFIDGAGVESDLQLIWLPQAAGSPGVFQYTFDPSAIGQSFTVSGTDGNDDFFVASLVVDADFAGIPLPGSLTFALTGLVGLAYVARRRVGR